MGYINKRFGIKSVLLSVFHASNCFFITIEYTKPYYNLNNRVVRYFYSQRRRRLIKVMKRHQKNVVKILGSLIEPLSSEWSWKFINFQEKLKIVFNYYADFSFFVIFSLFFWGSCFISKYDQNPDIIFHGKGGGVESFRNFVIWHDYLVCFQEFYAIGAM